MLSINISIVTIINIIAFFLSSQINIAPLLHLLSFGILLSFSLILYDMFYYILSEIYKKNTPFCIFVLLLIIYFILQFTLLKWYFFFRYENIEQFFYAFERSYDQILAIMLNDFRNINGIVLLSSIKSIIPNTWNIVYIFYSFFQFIGWVYLYRTFSLLSKNAIACILLTFLYFGIEIFFNISQTLTYLNLIIPSFIIFIYYILHLNTQKNHYSYALYFLSYFFLICWRPDFFFIALIIEFLNAYFSNKWVISIKKNILFYVLLIPYYFIITEYLSRNLFGDQPLLWQTYDTSNFWSIFIDTASRRNFLDTLTENMSIIIQDYMFMFFLLSYIVCFVYMSIYRKISWNFITFFLITYTVWYFLIVILIHEEWFIYSSFKYFSLIYLMIYILFSIFILQLTDSLKTYKKIYIYISLWIFVFMNFFISISNHFSLVSFLELDKNTITKHWEKLYERDYKSSVYNYYNTEEIRWKKLFDIYEDNRNIYDITYHYIFDANSRNNLQNYLDRKERPKKIW